MKRKRIIVLVTMAVLVAVAYTQLTVFVVQPIGAVPDGRTLVIWRRQKTRFIDSADGLCQREMGGVSLLCRMTVLSAVVGKEGDGILLRLPYSETLYLMSTDGKQYEK